MEELTPSANNYIVIDGEKSKIEKFNLFVRRQGVSELFFADSAWVYGRVQNNTEYFTTAGPVNEGVVAYVLANSTHNGVRYTFSVPKSKLTELQADVYHWWAGEWSVCDVECGEGIRTRAVRCVTLSFNKTEEQVFVDPVLCDPASKPTVHDRCFTEECVYEWNADNWSICDTACGNGQQTREITCKWQRRNGLQETVNTSLCEVAARPAELQACTVQCVYSWTANSWSNCDVICGDGQQSRTVECSRISADGSGLRVDDSFCIEDKVSHCSILSLFQWVLKVPYS